MLTAEKMLSDIATVTKATPVRVATEEDIRELLLFEITASPEREAGNSSVST